MKKKDILEIIDSDNNIIGTEDTPETGSNKETEASKTTDYNAKVHGQNFKNDFLGRFGFYFYESETTDKPEVIRELEDHFGGDSVIKIMSIIKPYLEKVINEMDTNAINESNVVEDKITKKEDKSIKDKKDGDDVISDDKVKKVANLLKKLPDNKLDKLITLLEKYK